MLHRNLIAAVAGVGMIATSSMAVAEPLRASASLPVAGVSAQKAMVSVRRQGHKVEEANSFVGIPFLLILAIGGAVSVVVVAAATGGFNGNGGTPG